MSTLLVSIRRAKAADAAALSAVFDVAWREAYSGIIPGVTLERMIARRGPRWWAFTLGRGVMHLEFTPRGEQVWISVRDTNRVEVFDTRSLARIASLPAENPSGIFLAARAGRIGF